MATLVEVRGNYSLQFYDPRREPERKRVSLQTRSRKVALRLKARWEELYEMREYDPWTGLRPDEPVEELSVQEALDRFCEAKRAKGCSESTVRNYRSTVERSGCNGLPIRSVRYEHVREFVQAGGVKQSTKRSRFVRLRAFMNWCHREGYRARGMGGAAPKVQETLPKAIRPEELERVIAAVRLDREEKERHLHGHERDIVWRVPLFRFAFLTGLRLSELSRLRWEHIDLPRGELRIERQKSGKASVLPLSSKAARVLEELPHRSGWVFCGPEQELEDRSCKTFGSNQSKFFRRYCDAAGIRGEVTFHSLRHGFATRLAEAGCNAATIKRLMRHSSIQTSMKYIHMAGSGLRDSLDRAFG